MVSLWPWKGQDSSPASFEKTLSTLSTKITATQSQLDRLRSNSRRAKFLWTLYLSFAYLIYAIVLTLVVGWQNLGAWEWSGMAGGPVLIYVLRTATNAYYTFRIDTLESRLKSQQAERAKTIQKLKDATKFDSTQELLEKYGGEKRTKGRMHREDSFQRESEKGKGSSKKNRQSIGPNTQGGRTNLPPPATANIQRSPSGPGPGTPQHPQGPYRQPPPPQAARPHEANAEFAPNAGPLPSSSHRYDVNAGPPRWYDRIMDLMLGEDETAPQNRVVLICNQCRLVNGQAPPGTKSLADLGTWKCMSCGAKNGEIDEGKKIIRDVLGGRNEPSTGRKSEDGRESDAGSNDNRSSDSVRVEGDSAGNESEDEPELEPEPEPTPAPAQPLTTKQRLRNKRSQMVP